MSLVMVKLIYVGKMSVWIFCVRVMARLVSGQMFTGLPMNHSWIVGTVLLAAGGVKDAAKHKIPRGLTSWRMDSTLTINSSLN